MAVNFQNSVTTLSEERKQSLAMINATVLSMNSAICWSECDLEITVIQIPHRATKKMLFNLRDITDLMSFNTHKVET